jgi:hypothetical protein
LSPASTLWESKTRKDVNGRVKPGHDGAINTYI